MLEDNGTLLIMGLRFMYNNNLINFVSMCDLDYRKEVGMTKFIPKAVLENMKVRFCHINIIKYCSHVDLRGKILLKN